MLEDSDFSIKDSPLQEVDTQLDITPSRNGTETTNSSTEEFLLDEDQIYIATAVRIYSGAPCLVSTCTHASSKDEARWGCLETVDTSVSQEIRTGTHPFWQCSYCDGYKC